MLKRDLADARSAWIGEKEIGEQEREQRKADKDFLAYVDSANRIADFHALRHTFITLLARGGVHPKLAQDLARHSDIRLTMNRYSHVGLYELAAAVDGLCRTCCPIRRAQKRAWAS